MYKRLKQVQLEPILAILDQLPFISVNQSGGKYACDVVLSSNFPLPLSQLIIELELGGELARAVLRRLAPGQGIPPHVDDWMPKELNWRRFQLPITSHPSIIMRWPEDGVETHLEPGWLYEVRYDRIHEVINPAPVERIHLQIDQINATI